jgi:hypothetical protein
VEGTPLFLGRGPDLQIDATSISRSVTDSVSDPDPTWIRIQFSEVKKFHVLKCWMFSFEG